jgi:CRISPR-associated protein Cas2
MLVICFDIFCDKRRRRVNRLLLGYGERVQYSVFECYISQSKIKQLQQEMVDIIDGEDKVNYFVLCEKDRGQRQAFGVGEVSSASDYYYL